MPVNLRIVFKSCCIVFKCLRDRTPGYLRELLTPASRPARIRQPAAINELVIPRTSRKIGSSSLAVAGPHTVEQIPTSS